ncbi:hypothetical protein [Streptomyces sp. NRRL B-24484]|uniref:hypothetical protein n=1 Tax=Streptomyces sp. NRRL B-24484 TaxID=1463833 RepID=UPI0004C1AE7F|nr:hypothetical protein [Streptomyces sp. NRRL B-24484]
MDEDGVGSALDAEALRGAAAAEGHQVTDRMLETFRSQQLLPRPERAANRGRRPVWHYPPGTDQQLLALLRWREHTRDVDTLRVLLWLDGYQVPTPAARESLIATLDRWMATLHDAIVQLDSTNDRDAALTAAAATLAGRRGQHTVLPRDTRLTTAQRTDAAELMLRIFVFGEDTAPGEEQALVVEKALGLAPGRRDKVAGAGPWLTGPAAALFDAGRLVSLPALAAAVHGADDQTLEMARTATTALFRALPLLARLLTATSGQDNPAGMKAFGRIDEDPNFVHLALAMVIALQSEGGPFADSLSQVTDSLNSVPALAAGLDQVMEMPQPEVTANLATLPPATREQAHRLIDAAAQGDHRRLPLPPERPR